MMKNVVALAAGAFALCLGQQGMAQERIELAYALSADSHFGDFASAFETELESLSGGKFDVVQMASHLGANERGTIEAVQLGTTQSAIVATATMTNFVPETGVLDLPYLFRDTAHARSVQDGEIGASILDTYQNYGLVALAFGEVGFRSITTSKVPVRTPADLKNLKIRVQQADDHLLAFEAMGALPTPMAFGELYTALQTGTLDGQENAISVMLPSRIYEVQKYYSPTNHMFTNTVFIVTPAVWEGLSDEEKGWFRAAAAKGIAAERARVDRELAEGLEIMKAAGVEIVDNVDVVAFAAAVEPAYEVYNTKYDADLITRIKAAE